LRPKLGVVPFRDSKLTEVFQDFFAGNGRASMIVNVNPFDTGFDENSQVMKFSAIAREVSTAVAKPSNNEHRTVRLSLADESYDALFDILEEVDSEDEQPINPLVDSLFDEIECLRKRLHETESRANRIEIEVREEVMKDMVVQMRVMEESYARRLRSELEHNEKKLDQKIDLLYRGGQLRDPLELPCETESTATSSTPCETIDAEGSDSSRHSKQRSNDLGLFEHDDKSASETEADSFSGTSEAEEEAEEAGGSFDENESEEYCPPKSVLSASNQSTSTGSEDSLDFLSPKRKSVARLKLSRELSDHLGKLTFSKAD